MKHAIEVLESGAVELIKENHTLLHEAEFAGRNQIAAGTLRIIVVFNRGG
jgi:hypothetical protein